MDLQNFEHYAGSGSPVVGAQVKAYVASLTTPNPNVAQATTLTDANGMWSFTGLTDGQAYDVKVELPGINKAKWYRGLVKIGLQQVSALEPLAGLDNPILNGGFNHWPQGTSFAAIASGTYHADHWAYQNTSAAVHTVQRSTDVPAVAANTIVTPYSLHADCTTADASVAVGDFTALQTYVEGFSFAPFAQKAFVLSFWVKSTKTGIFSVAFRNTGNDRTFIGEYTVNVADTWEYKTIAVPASPSLGTWDYTTNVALKVAFTLMCGSTYHLAAGSWGTGNFLASPNQVNACDNVVNDFKLWGVTITPGTTARMFTPRHPALEEMLLRRYFLRLGGTTNSPLANGGYVVSATQALIPVVVPAMRNTVVPTFTSAGNYAVSSAAGSPTMNSISANSTSPNGFVLIAGVAAGLTAGQGCYPYALNTSGTVDISARY